jgi:integrase
MQGDDFPARPSCARDDQRELACLKRMFNVARKGLIVLKGGIPLTNPVGSVSLEHENNVRDRVLSHEDTKTQEGRAIPLTKELTQMLQQSTIYHKEDGQRVPDVFTSGGKRIHSIRRSFETAWRRAGISGVRFHDLCHTFVTNMRRAGWIIFGSGRLRGIGPWRSSCCTI